MKKPFMSLLLALVLCLSLLPSAASAAESSLPDWYFLFAIFKNVDAVCKDKDGKTVHTKYTMTQEEVDFAQEDARDFEAYMNKVGVMRAHVEVVEIDAPITELADYPLGGYLSPTESAPLLASKVDLSRYDHITCLYSLNIPTDYLGRGGSSYESGAGHSGINLRNREYCLKVLRYTEKLFPASMYVHEFLHFMENQNQKWGAEFGLHDIRINHYTPDDDNGKACYTDIIRNRAKGTAGTGVQPFVWQYSPRVLQAKTECTIPSSVTRVGDSGFRECTNLTGVTFSSGNTSIGDRAFWGLKALTRVTIPTSMTNIGYAAFWETGVKDVYYAGTEAQWKAIQTGDYNEALTKANIHYNHLMADVKTTDYFAQPVVWALERAITAGTGGGKFSPRAACTQGQILTFLWRANGSPKPAGAVSGGKYYASAVQWAKELGLADGALSAGSPCTRAMAVTYLWKLAGSPQAGASGFQDVAADAPYAQAAAWAVREGVTSGTGANDFSPDSPCTRGQIVTFLYRALAG
ncbi:MAG: leucine-rich repeat protein [Oscillibacter sp.]|nr:leucine-rich repeat protein [Oscillibacter sp.]